MSGVVKTVLGEHPHKVSVDQVRAIHAAQAARFASVPDANVMTATRTEVHAALQLECPFPPPEAVTDEHRVRSDVERAMDPNHTSAHHWLQKRHGQALWAETERLIAEAGVK